MNPFLGIVLHALGGLAAGSFYIPFRKVKHWGWESYWLIQGVAAWIIMPLLVVYLTTPDAGKYFPQIDVQRIEHHDITSDGGDADSITIGIVDAHYANGGESLIINLSSRFSFKTLALVYLFGALWGVGGLTFGLSMRYLGMSLGYALALGFCAAFGTMIPPMFTGKFNSLLTTASGLVLVAGVAVCLVGIGICGKAGIRKERELTDEQKKKTIKEFALVKGFAVAIFAGIMSACMAFAISAGAPIAEAVAADGTPDIYRVFPIYVVAMAGGFTTNFFWCLYLNLKNKTIGDYISGSIGILLPNYLFAGLAGVIWYGQFFFYGMGTTQMGKYDFSSWSIHMAFIIIFSNLWGIYFREWKDVSRLTWKTVWMGIAALIVSVTIIGLGNYLAPSD